MASVQKAAQELIEMEALCMNLRSRRSECVGKIKSIKTTDDTSYFLADSEVKYLRIFEAQWEVYNYINTLHALWGFVVQCDPYIDGSQYSLMSTAPELLALRNCMQHAGPVGVNYIPNQNELVIPIQRLKQRGNWGGNHAAFSDYFPNYQKGDLLVLRDSIEKSDSFYKSIAKELENKHVQNHSRKVIKQAASQLSLYN